MWYLKPSEVVIVPPVAVIDGAVFVNDPEKGFYEDFQQISGSVGKPEDKLRDLRLLEKAIFTHIMKGNHSAETIGNLKDVHKQVSDMIQSLGSNVNP